MALARNRVYRRSKAEQVAIELAALRQFFHIEPEMAEATDLKWPLLVNPADIVTLLRRE
jgi:hypothetical protein